MDMEDVLDENLNKVLLRNFNFTPMFFDKSPSSNAMPMVVSC